MPIQMESLSPQYIFSIIMRRRWVIMIPLLAAMLLGIFKGITLPRVYQAETLILVEPQRVPTNYVKSVVSIDINDRISTISQQVMSRTNIEKIIADYNLYAEPEQQNMYLEDKLEAVRAKIGVNVTRTRGGADAFSLSFKGTEPQKVMRIANTLASYFIDENLKVREEQASGTSNFLEEELKLKKSELEKMENNLKNYRIKHMGGLPEQLDTNLRILDRLHEEYNLKQAEIRERKYQLALAKKQADIFSDSQGDIASGLDLEADSGSADIAELESQIDRLKLRYTDKHPDIVKLKSMIAKIKEKEQEASTADDSEKGSQETAGNESAPMDIFNSAGIQNQGLEFEMKKLESEVKKLEYKIKHHTQLVEDTPTREQELLSLNRDYQNVKEAYNSLLQRKLEAGIAVNMERKQKGEQFRVIDYAKLPEKPISPDMRKLFALMIICGLGIGGGLSFVLEYFDHSYRDAQSVEEDFSYHVLAVIPTIADRRKAFMQKLNTISSVMMAGATLMVFGVFAFMVTKDVDRLIESVKGLF